MRHVDTKRSNVFVYDGDCGFCTKFVHSINKRNLQGVQILSGSAVSKDYQKLLQDTSIFLVCTEREEELKNVTTYTHNESVGQLLQCSSSWQLRWLGKVFCTKLLSKFFKFIYTLIAKNRHIISRVLSTGGSCSIE